MSSFAIGVDLGGTNLRIAAVSEDGRVLEKMATGTEVARGRDSVLDEMCGAISRLTAEVGSGKRLVGIGIGVPGIIDLETGMLYESPNLPGWHDYPVRDEIERRLTTRVVLENDANCAALGEAWMGAARGFPDMCMITLGTGVGGGIVLGGRIWHGMTGMAGELGHITVVPDGVPCGCGNRGCIEQYASASAVERMAREVLGEARGKTGKAQRTARAVFEQAQHGDKQAQGIFDTVGRMLGVLIGDLVNALNLPMYVIGGGVAGAWEAFSPAMFEEVKKRSFVYAATAPEGGKTRRRTEIRRAELGSDAGLIGAARLPMLPAEYEQHMQGR
ncbi:MAG TPA: ROK family protein [Terriglobales bacterium]|nr:ROK family protein [Terriglobales bacterium]